MAIDFIRTSDEYLDLGDNGDVTANLSIALWMKKDLNAANTTYWLVGKDDETDGRAYAFGAPSDGSQVTNLNLQIAGTNADAKGGTDLANGTWYHTGVTFIDATNAVEYLLNGASDGTAACTGVLAATSGPLQIARRSYAGAEDPFDGKLEDVRIYNRILNSQEWLLLASGYRGPLGGEVVWLDMCSAHGVSHFDGTSLAQGTNYIPDRSGNGYNGDPYNTPTAKASDCPRFGGWLGSLRVAFAKQSYAGAFVAAGAVTKATSVSTAGPFVSTGTVTKKGKKPVAGIATFTGNLVGKAKKALAGAITFAGALAKYKLWIFFARFHDYFLNAPQRFTISSNEVQMTARYRDYNLTGPEKK